MTDRTEWTDEDLIAEAINRFGTDPISWQFECPSCHDIATAQDFIDADADPSRVGQDCIGRVFDQKGVPRSRGCDWVAYGLFGGPWRVHVRANNRYPERYIYSFALATREGER